MIRIEHVSKTYRTRSGDVVDALVDIELEIRENEFVSLVGPSGCGKSTLLKLVAGLVPASDGTIAIRGQELREPCGLKVAVTLAVIGAVVGEFVGSDKGLGYVILSATAYWKSDVAFGAMILLSLMAIVLFALVALAERIICPWYADEQRH